MNDGFRREPLVTEVTKVLAVKVLDGLTVSAHNVDDDFVHKTLPFKEQCFYLRDSFEGARACPLSYPPNYLKNEAFTPLHKPLAESPAIIP